MRSRILALVFFLVLFCSAVRAQTFQPLINPHVQYLDNNGKPLANGKIYTYAAGTSTKAATFTDATGTVSNSNPIILDSAGVATIYLDPAKSYKIVVQNAQSVQQWAVDNVTGGMPTSGGGGMIYPPGSGIPQVVSGASWGATYNAGNQIPANYVSTLNQSTTGNAATATALAGNPTLCPAGQYALGILASGNATGCTAAASGGVTSINGNSTAAQVITGTAPITVNSAGGTTTVACPTCGVSGGTALSQITAAGATNTIANGNFLQTWNWALTGATNGMAFGESSAGAGTGAVVQINGLSNAVTPLDVQNSSGQQAQLHFGSAPTGGGWLYGGAGGAAWLMAGATYTGGAIKANSGTPAIIQINSAPVAGGFQFFGDTGKTIGSTFTPTAIGTLAPAGLSGIASINTPGNTTTGSLTISGLTSKTSLATDSSGNVIAGTAGGPLNPVANISGTYNATAADFQTCAMKYSASGAVTVNLPINTSQPANGQCMIFLNYSTGGTITINRNGQNINGGTGAIIVPAAVNAVQPGTATVWSDGTNYFSTRVSPTVAFAAVTGGTAASQAFVIGASSTLGFSGTGAMISPVVNTGVAQGSGMKHQRVASCTTPASVNGTCAAGLTWTTAFVDANYSVSCSSISSPGAAVTITSVTNAAVGLVFYNIAGLSSAITGTIDCIAMHD